MEMMIDVSVAEYKIELQSMVYVYSANFMIGICWFELVDLICLQCAPHLKQSLRAILSSLPWSSA